MKTHTDYEQSKKLAGIISSESADMFFPPGEVRFAEVIKVPPLTREDWTHVEVGTVPAWSLSALLEVLPKIHKLKPLLDLEENSIMYSGTDTYIFASNPVDACYETILKLHELKLL